MVIREEKNLSREELDVFLSNTDGVTFFHTSAWLDSISSAFRNIEPSCIVARDAGRIRGLMPICRIRRCGFFVLSALPFGTYGIPLSDDNRVVLSLLTEFRRLGRSFRCLESVASLYGMDELRQELLPEETRDEECLVIDIGGGFEKYRSKQLSRKKRQICNGCEKGGVEARPLANREDRKSVV